MASSEGSGPPMPPRPDEKVPMLPPRHEQHQAPPPYDPQDYVNQPMGQKAPGQPALDQPVPDQPAQFQTPPQRMGLEQHDISSPIHFTRDPHKLVGYLVPFPKPTLHNIPPDRIPPRFLIYTPPPPPLSKPAEGEKEGKMHKIQRKWQEELREAKTGNAKTASWKGVKGKVTKGISWGMSQTKTSSLDFLNRITLSQEETVPPQQQQQQPDLPDKHADDGHDEGHETKRTVKLEEMLLIYPASMPTEPDALRKEFVDTMLRSKSKAERDAIIASGLLPISAAIDILATLVWPFGGLLEIDSVWLYASIRGAKTSRSVTKRLTSTASSSDTDKDHLQLTLTPSPRLEILEHYLASQCHANDSKLFPSVGAPPTESQVLEAIGWFPSSKGGEERNWEDEQWEITEVKDDLRNVMHKGAKEWDKWCKLFEKHPEKAMKK